MLDAPSEIYDLVGSNVVVHLQDNSIIAGRLRMIGDLLFSLEEDGIVSNYAWSKVYCIEEEETYEWSDEDEDLCLQRMLEISTEKFIGLKRYFMTDYGVSEDVVDTILEEARAVALALGQGDPDILHE